MADETKILPPGNPLALAFNEAVIDWYFPQWARANLPGYEVVITSKTRQPGKNEAVGGAQNSAHLHGLAVDFYLLKDGKRLSRESFQQVFDTKVVPSWPGFALFEYDHIHVNLSREITTWAGVFAASVLGLLGLMVYKGVKGK